MGTLERTAAYLSRRNRGRKALPSLLFFTDPERTPDFEAIAERLPRGAGVVYRAFGAADAQMRGQALAGIARRRGLVLLAGADPALARAIGADGVHLPERLAHRASSVKAAQPRWIVTTAAHSLRAARAAFAAGADAVVVSPAFESRSRSAGPPLGPVRLALLARAAKGQVYALGGITNKNARRLAGLRLVGLAAVEAFRT